MTAEAAATTRGTTAAWLTVFVLMGAQTVSFVDRMIMGLLVGPIRETFAISDTQFSLLAGLAFAIFYSTMGLPLAWIADRFSRTRLIAAGVTLWSIATAVCGLAQGFWSLFAARVAVGVGEASLGPAAYSLISDVFPKSSLARALSIFTLGVTLGSGIAYIVGGQVIAYVQTLDHLRAPIIGELRPWQAVFFIVGLPGIAVALMVLALPEPPRRGMMSAVGAAPSLSQVIAYFSKRRRAVLTHVLGVSIFIISVFSLNIWGPEYLMRTFQMARADAGLTFGFVIMGAGAAGLMCGGALADRWFQSGTMNAYSRVILLSMACMAPFAIGLAFAPSLPWGVLYLALAVFFSAFQGGIAGGVMQLMTPNEMRGTAAALYFLVANLLGMGLGPTAVALCTDFVFRSDAALDKSLALVAAVCIPVASLIILSGLRQVGDAIAETQTFQ